MEKALGEDEELTDCEGPREGKLYGSITDMSII